MPEEKQICSQCVNNSTRNTKISFNEKISTIKKIAVFSSSGMSFVCAFSVVKIQSISFHAFGENVISKAIIYL